MITQGGVGPGRGGGKTRDDDRRDRPRCARGGRREGGLSVATQLPWLSQKVCAFTVLYCCALYCTRLHRTGLDWTIPYRCVSDLWIGSFTSRHICWRKSGSLEIWNFSDFPSVMFRAKSNPKELSTIVSVQGQHDNTGSQLSWEKIGSQWQPGNLEIWNLQNFQISAESTPAGNGPQRPRSACSTEK